MTKKSIEARNKLVESHLYLADILIRKFLGKGIDYDDLYQVAAMALVSAADRFDESLGFAFSTFATPTILGEIKKYFRDKGWSVKMPRRLKENASAIAKIAFLGEKYRYQLTIKNVSPWINRLRKLSRRFSRVAIASGLFASTHSRSFLKSAYSAYARSFSNSA